ncbi:hypothetical protein S7335_669 [Synechococcus sp. PCC 7335]|uniref:DUF4278 domain-containing protein n=1 Tax=Synechococcus sp. (strain ATCC 29403 / PCC 7335) TaxID=91464 RepID=UPI00017EB53D|nr:DUF4278 domain-containing protein [Synechococcus sp. PCC 7335]EDX83489.1 hypothetical protein S7335_669 [Synechococcus sp. PCC 7335]
MQLTYRGVCYGVRHQPTKVTETAQEGQFLGARFRIRSAASIEPKRSHHQLSYRLAKYTT